MNRPYYDPEEFDRERRLDEARGDYEYHCMVDELVDRADQARDRQKDEAYDRWLAEQERNKPALATPADDELPYVEPF